MLGRAPSLSAMQLGYLATTGKSVIEYSLDNPNEGERTLYDMQYTEYGGWRNKGNIPYDIARVLDEGLKRLEAQQPQTWPIPGTLVTVPWLRQYTVPDTPLESPAEGEPYLGGDWQRPLNSAGMWKYGCKKKLTDDDMLLALEVPPSVHCVAPF